MRFMMIVKAREGQGMPPQGLIEAIAKTGEEAMRTGRMITTGGLYPTAASTEVRLTGGQVTVTDGPFVETKEVFGGFAIFELPSKKDAIDSTKAFMDLHARYWPGWEGSTEVRQMYDAPDFSSPEKTVACAEPAKAR